MEIDKRSQSPSYYSILGVNSDSSVEQIKHAYRKLAMQWHPDRWAKKPSLLGEAKRNFQRIQEAYSVLSDYKKRRLYDAGLFDPNEEEEEEEGFSDFVQELVSLMSKVREEEKNCSLEELQEMLKEMAQGYDSPAWYCEPCIGRNSRCSKRTKRTRWGTNIYSMHPAGVGVYDSRRYCN